VGGDAWATPRSVSITLRLAHADVRFDHFNVRNVPAMLKRRKRDPWDELPRVRQTLSDAMLQQVGAKAARK